MQLSKRKTRHFFKLYVDLTELSSLLTVPGPVLAMLLAAQGNATLRQGGVRARTTWKDSTVRGEFFFLWLCFKNEKYLSEDLGLSIREINSLSFTSSDANLDFSIWIPPIQEAVPPASVLDTLQSVPVLWATVSIASRPASTLVKLGFPLYLRLGCRLESEAIKKTHLLPFCARPQTLDTQVYDPSFGSAEAAWSFHVYSLFVQMGRNEFTALASGTELLYTMQVQVGIANRNLF